MSGRGNSPTTTTCSDVVHSSPPPRPTASASRIITLQPKDYKKAGLRGNLLCNLEELLVEIYIEGARSIGSAFFEVTADSITSYKEVKSRFQESDYSLYDVIEKEEEEPYSLIIDGLHAEYPTVAITEYTEYLHKYFEEPRVERQFHNCTRILNGKAKVLHQGMKMPLKPFLFVGPNMS